MSNPRDACSAPQAPAAAASIASRRFEARDVGFVLLLTIRVVPLIAATWAVVWLAFDVFVVWPDEPSAVASALFLLAGICAGAVVAFPAIVFRRLSNPVAVRAGLFGMLAALLAFPLGEILLSTIRVWGALRIFSLELGVMFARQVAINGDSFFLILRGTTLVASLLSAFGYARTPKRLTEDSDVAS